MPTKILLLISAAAAAYLVAGRNPAIDLSKAIYKKDIRTCGSGNPGFTNFKRVFGNRWAPLVLVLDLFKSAAVAVIFALLFEKYSLGYQFGAAYTGFFAMLGHAYPVWYGFKGGKGFLVCLSTVYVVDYRVGLIATAVMAVLLLATKYMSLSTVTAMLACPVLLILFRASASAVVLCTVCVVFMAARHRENFKRLRNGTEAKFAFRHS